MKILAQFSIREANVLQLYDVWSDEIVGAEESTGFFAGLEYECQLGELGGTGTEVQPVQIVLQDETWDVIRRCG
jgi:hypothetical protein